LEHDVFDLAKTVATLDQLSGGRFLFGVGVGWNGEELANHRRDLPWSQRYRALGDCISALRSLWCDDESEHHGEYFDFDPVWSFPKPAQQPHPPILCGTGRRVGTREAVTWADAWMPTEILLGDVPRKLAKFREVAAAAGRDAIPITLWTWGDPTPDALVSYRDLGVERVVVGAGRTGGIDPATILPFVDAWAEVIPDLV